MAELGFVRRFHPSPVKISELIHPRAVALCAFLSLLAFFTWAWFYMLYGHPSLSERLPDFLGRFVLVFLTLPVGFSSFLLPRIAAIAAGSDHHQQALWCFHHRWVESSFIIALTILELWPLVLLTFRPWQRISFRLRAVMAVYVTVLVVMFCDTSMQ